MNRILHKFGHYALAYGKDDKESGKPIVSAYKTMPFSAFVHGLDESKKDRLVYLKDIWEEVRNRELDSISDMNEVLTALLTNDIEVQTEVAILCDTDSRADKLVRFALSIAEQLRYKFYTISYKII